MLIIGSLILDSSPPTSCLHIPEIHFFWPTVWLADLLPTHLRVLGDPVSQHVENSVGGRSPDDELLVAGFLSSTKT